MNIKNILTLSTIGGLLLLGVIASLIVSPLLWCPTVGAAFYIPEALGEIE